MRSYGELTGRYDSQATMGVYTYINKDAKRGAAGAVPEMFWAHGRCALDGVARLWYTGIGDPKRMASKCRGLFPRLFSYLQGVSLRGPSRPVDESGSDNLCDEHYLLVFVLHEQSDPITHEIERYEQSLRDKCLPDIPLHLGPLLTGHEGYEDMPLVDRKRLPSSFRILFRNLPVRHACIALRYRDGEPSATDEKFFGSWSQFKKGILREMRAKRV